MPIKQKKPSRENGKPHERPDWDARDGAAPGESADARIRRMSMQMASAERSGFRGERSDLYGGLPKIAVWAIRLGAAAAVIAGIFALPTLFRNSDPPRAKSTSDDEDPIAALIRSAREMPDEPKSSSPEKNTEDAFEWHSTKDESFSPFRETILSFFDASTPAQRKAFVIPAPQVEKRLEDHADNALFDLIYPPDFAKTYGSGDGWISVDVLLPSFGFRPVIVMTSGGENKIDLDAFLGYNARTITEIHEDLESGQQVTIRTLATLSSSAADTPGDMLLVLRDPDDTLLLSQPINARLSKFGSTPEHIVSWLSKGKPLPFTVTVIPEISLSGESSPRISEIRADAWSSGLTPTPVALAPSKKFDSDLE